MSASTDHSGPSVATGAIPPSADSALSLTFVWRVGGLWYLVLLLGGLAAGLWPAAIYPQRGDISAAPLPTLQTLAEAQLAFILIVQPLLVIGRAERSPAGVSSALLMWESVVLMGITAPFYVGAAWLADATAADVARTAFYVLCCWPMGWALAYHLRRGGARSAAVVLLAAVAIVLPALYYLAREFILPGGPAEKLLWLWQIAPATFVWDVAASRSASWLPQPLWAGVLWLSAALVIGVARLLFSSSPDEK